MGSSTSYKIALSGVISSLSVFAMFLTGVLPVMYLALPMIAGGLLLVVVAEVNDKWAFVTYASISFLSLFITPDKEAALMFILFFGHYPIIKQNIEKIASRLIRLISKLAVYNVCVIIAFQISSRIFGADEILDEISGWGEYGLYILLAATNFIFLIYDYMLSGYMMLYLNYFKPRFLGKK